ncbi:hypothetical protein B0H10DRAFT_1962070 [Mycena sp. CBHHK59/15]|nr:hypothetical protein B0H10DRAFT_1962070 [Mycena sp. CBHHK59/15]
MPTDISPGISGGHRRPPANFPAPCLGSRIYADLLRKARLTVETKHIRMYNSLNFEAYNAETRELMKKQLKEDGYCQIIIGTDTLSVGVAMRGCVDALLVGAVEDTDQWLQKLGVELI